jgi:FkbM family methyltransferase
MRVGEATRRFSSLPDWRRGLAKLLEPFFEGERAIRVGADDVHVEGADHALVALGWKVGLLARRERALIARAAEAGTAVVDVGAHIGLTTLALARKVGPNGRVYALEPEASNFRLLSRTVAEAELAQVELRQVAAADHSGWMTLYLATGDRGDHRILPAEEERALVTVRAVALDDLLTEEERVSLVVIDVRGAESSVLRGMRATLARRPAPKILCTVAPALLRRAGVGRDAFFDPLRETGLAPHRIESNGAIEPISPAAAWSLAESIGSLPIYFG